MEEVAHMLILGIGLTLLMYLVAVIMLMDMHGPRREQ